MAIVGSWRFSPPRNLNLVPVQSLSRASGEQDRQDHFEVDEDRSLTISGTNTVAQLSSNKPVKDKSLGQTSKWEPTIRYGGRATPRMPLNTTCNWCGIQGLTHENQQF